MELDKILTISTAHVTRDELDRMTTVQDTPNCIAMQHGGLRMPYWTAFFICDIEEGFEKQEDDRQNWPSLAFVHDFAAAHGCRYFRLDPDAAVVENLPMHQEI